jgi:DNA polymerase III sliding clamp (beta) subunit (PCNA family)
MNTETQPEQTTQTSTDTVVSMPTSLKNVCAADHSRYAINGAYIATDGNTGAAVATNGHMLALLTGLDVEGPPASAIVPRGCMNTRKAGSRVRIGAERSECEGAAGSWTSADNVEGSFVPFLDVLPDTAGYVTSVTLNAAYLKALADALATGDSPNAVTIHITNPSKPVYITGANPDGIGVLMPCSGDDRPALAAVVDRCRAAALELFPRCQS